MKKFYFIKLCYAVMTMMIKNILKICQQLLKKAYIYNAAIINIDILLSTKLCFNKL